MAKPCSLSKRHYSLHKALCDSNRSWFSTVWTQDLLFLVCLGVQWEPFLPKQKILACISKCKLLIIDTTCRRNWHVNTCKQTQHPWEEGGLWLVLTGDHAQPEGGVGSTQLEPQEWISNRRAWRQPPPLPPCRCSVQLCLMTHLVDTNF